MKGGTYPYEWEAPDPTEEDRQRLWNRWMGNVYLRRAFLGEPEPEMPLPPLSEYRAELGIEEVSS